MNDQWTVVDQYFADLLVPSDPVLDAALQATADAGMPPINVAPNQGKLLHVLARMCGARTILEIGTLGGYSTIWLARSLPPDGRLVTLEADPRHAEIARRNIARAGFANNVDVRVGQAVDTLAQLAAETHAPFDLVFIDADKQNTTDYLDWGIKLARPGSVIILDNVVRNGAVIDATSTDTTVQGMRRGLEALAHDPRVTATALQTVGSKGYDGFALALVTQM